MTHSWLVLALELRTKVDITLLNLLKNFTFAKMLAFELQTLALQKNKIITLHIF